MTYRILMIDLSCAPTRYREVVLTSSKPLLTHPATADGTVIPRTFERSTNTGKRWTATQVRQLRQLASQKYAPRVIGLKLGRTENAVRTKTSEKGVSLCSHGNDAKL